MNEEKQEEIALFRHGLLFPVLRDGLRRGALTEHLREVAAKKHKIPHSEKTDIGFHPEKVAEKIFRRRL